MVHCGLDRTFVEAPQARRRQRAASCASAAFTRRRDSFCWLRRACLPGRAGTQFELVLVGDGELRSQIEVLLQSHGLADRVRITGWISGAEVRQKILAARALVLA